MKIQLKTTMPRQVIRLLVSLLLLAGVYACSGSGSSGGSGDVQNSVDSQIELVQSQKPRNTAPDATSTELAELVAGNTTFALALYRQLSDGDENLFFSPLSISMALAMTYAGAAGETATQMASTLNFTLDPDRLHTAFNALDLELASRGDEADGKDDEGFRLNIANATWGQSGYSFLTSFLDVLAENYGAGMRLLDFQTDPESARLTINDWVDEQTEGKIQDLLPYGSISSLTRLVLTNTIYFNAAWKLPFDPQLTAMDDFYTASDSLTTAAFMNQNAVFAYAAGENYQMVELPYDGGELSMVIILPDEGAFETVENSLDASVLETMLTSLAPADLDLKMPKFTLEPEGISLTQIFSDMGMVDAFTQSADFSGMDGTRSLSISDILHKAFVDVDEAGTEAAAATAVVIGETALPPAPAVLNLDRPFIFLIRDIPTQAVVFMGRLMAPSPVRT